jgi:hypothetical protein
MMPDPVQDMTEPSRAPTIGEAMILIAGAAAGLGMIRTKLDSFGPDIADDWFAAAVSILWGISLVGPFLIVRGRWRHRTPWHPAERLWIIQAIAGWLLLPPIEIAHDRLIHVISYIKKTPMSGRSSLAVDPFFLILHALSVAGLAVAMASLVEALPVKRLRTPATWKEWCAVVLGMLWTCAGLYSLSKFYRDAILP